jgi:DNA-binding MarR family transcriptional regulator
MVNPEPQVGYVLKQAQSLLRRRLEEALRPLDLTVTQYSCMHHLRREPGISAAGLARSTFVTRQSMTAMLQQLIERGIVTRTDSADGGRAIPVALTDAGGDLLDQAQTAVDVVEERMLTTLTAADRRALARCLAACVAALEDD